MLLTKGQGAPGPNEILGLGPAAWFRFNIGVAADGSQWDDASGNARHLLQATATNRPAKQANGSLLFDGVDNFMRTAPFTLNQPFTEYLLMQQVTWGSNRYFSDGATLNSTILGVGGAVVEPQFEMFAGANAATNGNLAVNTYAVVVAVFNGASSLDRVNNTTEVTGNAGANNAGGFTLGGGGDVAANFSNIQVKEVILFASAHTKAQRDLVVQYLATLGGLSI